MASASQGRAPCLSQAPRRAWALMKAFPVCAACTSARADRQYAAVPTQADNSQVASASSPCGRGTRASPPGRYTRCCRVPADIALLAQQRHVGAEEVGLGRVGENEHSLETLARQFGKEGWCVRRKHEPQRRTCCARHQTAAGVQGQRRRSPSNRPDGRRRLPIGSLRVRTGAAQVPGSHRPARGSRGTVPVLSAPPAARSGGPR
jgi:hypothetical protein